MSVSDIPAASGVLSKRAGSAAAACTNGGGRAAASVHHATGANRVACGRPAAKQPQRVCARGTEDIGQICRSLLTLQGIAIVTCSVC